MTSTEPTPSPVSPVAEDTGPLRERIVNVLAEHKPLPNTVDRLFPEAAEFYADALMNLPGIKYAAGQATLVKFHEQNNAALAKTNAEFAEENTRLRSERDALAAERDEWQQAAEAEADLLDAEVARSAPAIPQDAVEQIIKCLAGRFPSRLDRAKHRTAAHGVIELIRSWLSAPAADPDETSAAAVMRCQAPTPPGSVADVCSTGGTCPATVVDCTRSTACATGTPPATSTSTRMCGSCGTGSPRRGEAICTASTTIPTASPSPAATSCSPAGTSAPTSDWAPPRTRSADPAKAGSRTPAASPLGSCPTGSASGSPVSPRSTSTGSRSDAGGNDHLAPAADPAPATCPECRCADPIHKTWCTRIDGPAPATGDAHEVIEWGVQRDDGVLDTADDEEDARGHLVWFRQGEAHLVTRAVSYSPWQRFAPSGQAPAQPTECKETARDLNSAAEIQGNRNPAAPAAREDTATPDDEYGDDLRPSGPLAPISSLTGQPCGHAADKRCVECVGDGQFRFAPIKTDTEEA